MVHLLKYKLLSIPLIIWGLQLLYVVVALLLFVVIRKALDKKVPPVPLQVLYVLVMLAVNIAWRVAIKKMKPGWF